MASELQNEVRTQIELAMSAALTIEPGHLICSAPETGSANAMQGLVRPAMRYRTGLQSHGFPEICIALKGKAELELTGRRYLLMPPRIAILEPGAIHCEAYHRRASSYTLLWLGGTRSSLLTHCSNYVAKGRSHTHSSWAWQIPQATALLARLAMPKPDMQPQWVEAFRQELLAVLSAIYLKADRACGLPLSSQADPVQRHEGVLRHVRTLIEEHPDNPLSVSELAEMTNFTPNYLNTLFRKWAGKSIHAYQIEQRMNRAHKLCETTDLLVKEIAYQLGYNDPFYFSRAFTKYFGQSPSEVRDAHRNGPA